MKHFLIRVATPIVLIVLWQLFADAFGSPRMPRPSAVVASAMKLIGSGELVTALVTSLGRVFSAMPWRFVDYWAMTHDPDFRDYRQTRI